MQDLIVILLHNSAYMVGQDQIILSKTRLHNEQRLPSQFRCSRYAQISYLPCVCLTLLNVQNLYFLHWV